ncbi:methylaspartate mutase [Pseudomonas monteilii]|uniref:methylaspartate mutase n=1 Tax=Pseudomonas monteilii TaxID=76759 RepID=UPI000761DF0F|nr:methylaspartate mutase [Pseudomonas monteilii]
MPPLSSSHFQSFIERARARGQLVVQPRMGFGDITSMRGGLQAVSRHPGALGTITLDSYTRVGDYQGAQRCLNNGSPLNGFPIINHPLDALRNMLNGLHGKDFPIQVRHGTAKPQSIFKRMTAVGLEATEGGPVSYCMPYSRMPLRHAVDAWTQSCQLLAEGCAHGHIESFGGCLLGQLCPPSMLLAVGLLEALFFRQHGIRSVSISYTQGTSVAQDQGALRALRLLAAELLGDIHWHVVVYTYMGVFPKTVHGARRLIADSVTLAKATGCERLIVKTVAEARQIPTIRDNLRALKLASATAARSNPSLEPTSQSYFEEILIETRQLLNAVLNLRGDIGPALVQAFARGLLDIPYCLHPDNGGRTRTRIDGQGALRWASCGRLPLASHNRRMTQVRADQLSQMLYYMVNRYDKPLH